MKWWHWTATDGKGRQLLPGAEAFDACTEGMCGV
jgi:hypothetical protein